MAITSPATAPAYNALNFAIDGLDVVRFTSPAAGDDEAKLETVSGLDKVSAVQAHIKGAENLATLTVARSDKQAIEEMVNRVESFGYGGEPEIGELQDRIRADFSGLTSVVLLEGTAVEQSKSIRTSHLIGRKSDGEWLVLSMISKSTVRPF